MIECKKKREELVSEHIGLVYWVANKFYKTKKENNVAIEYEDLVGFAFVGFTKALNNYDESMNNKFTTFATTCMMNTIITELQKAKRHNKDVSSDKIISSDGDGKALTIGDTVALADTNVDIYKDVSSKENISILEACIKDLSEEEEHLLSYRFGLLGRSIITQKEYAERFNMSQPNISRKEKIALSKMKAILKSKYDIHAEEDLGFFMGNLRTS